MAYQKKRPVRTTLRHSFPIAQYVSVLLISLNLHRLPQTTWLLPGIYGPRQWLMLWTVLLMFLGMRAGAFIRRAGKDDLSYLALIVPGLFVLDALSIAHVYYSWYQSGVLLGPVSQPVAMLVSVGCILWIYGNTMPSLPFKSIWGIRTKKTLASQEAWASTHAQIHPVICILGAICLLTGTML